MRCLSLSSSSCFSLLSRSLLLLLSRPPHLLHLHSLERPAPLLALLVSAASTASFSFSLRRCSASLVLKSSHSLSLPPMAALAVFVAAMAVRLWLCWLRMMLCCCSEVRPCAVVDWQRVVILIAITAAEQTTAMSATRGRCTRVTCWAALLLSAHSPTSFSSTMGSTTGGRAFLPPFSSSSSSSELSSLS